MMTTVSRRGVIALAVLCAAYAAFDARAATISHAAALGPQAPLAQPENGFVGRLTVTPDHGPVGTPVEVTAEGLPPDQEFQLVWRTVSGRWNVAGAEYHGREYSPAAYEIARLKTDGAGRFATRFSAPEDFGFAHDVVVQQGKRAFTQTAFSIDMSVELSPKSGPVGTPISVAVKGIGWRQLENSWLLLYDNSFTGWISAVTTGGSATFTIPATGKPGVHVLDVIHGEFTFPYRNMQQSPEPDRPQFSLRFTMTDGAPVLPPRSELQAQTNVRRLAASGELSASPPFATIHAPVVVRGTGLSPGKTVQLQWATVTGNRVAGNGGWEESSRLVAEAKTNAAGDAEFRFTVPDDLGGAHRLWVDDGANMRSGTFWIAPSASSLDTDHGPAGTTFTIHLKGVGWTETANIYTVVYDNNYVGYACGFNSQGDVQIPLRATGEPGLHFIDLYPAVYKGKEGRPNNFRIPQLTYAVDHPGEDLPHFRFVFRVTGQTAPGTVGQ